MDGAIKWNSCTVQAVEPTTTFRNDGNVDCISCAECLNIYDVELFAAT